MVELSPTQRKTLALAVTAVSASVVFFFVAVVAWLGFKAFAFVAPAVVPVVLGYFLSLFFKPYYGFCRRVFRNPTLALVVLLLSVLVPLGAIAWYAGAMILDEVSNLIDQGPHLLAQVKLWAADSFPRLQALMDKLGLSVDQFGLSYASYGGAAAMKAGAGAVKLLKVVLSVLVALVFFVFFLTSRERRGKEFVSSLTFLKDETRGFLAVQIDSFFDILVSFFQRQTMICLIEGVLYGLGFWLVQMPYGFLVGFVLGVLNLIPFFGSVTCLPIALSLAFFGVDGSVMRLAMVAGVWLTGQILDGYVITPRIQGNKTGLGYGFVIFSFFFWPLLLGPLLGLLLAIPLSAFCLVLWQALKVRYIRPIV